MIKGYLINWLCLLMCIVGVPEQILEWLPLGLGLVMKDESFELPSIYF